MTEDQIKYMVNRFLSWKLPENFNPDAGISFKPTFNEHTDHPMTHEPTGTNLFDATQADVMVRHMIEGMPPGAICRADDLKAEVQGGERGRTARETLATGAIATPAPVDPEEVVRDLREAAAEKGVPIMYSNRKLLEKAAALIEEQAKRNEELREALEPFGVVASEWDGEPDNLEVELKAYDSGGPGILVDAFRRARSLVEDKNAKG